MMVVSIRNRRSTGVLVPYQLIVPSTMSCFDFQRKIERFFLHSRVLHDNQNVVVILQQEFTVEALLTVEPSLKGLDNDCRLIRCQVFQDCAVREKSNISIICDIMDWFVPRCIRLTRSKCKKSVNLQRLF